MKKKIAMIFVLLWIPFLSIGQNKINDSISTNTIRQEVLHKQDRTGIVETINFEKNNSNKVTKESLYDEKQWGKIKKKIQRNKKRFSNNKKTIQTFKAIDTIYLDAPNKISESRLSEW